MSAVNAFLVGLVGMLLATGSVLFLLRHSLHQLLIELCGEEHRARFWGQLYAATVILTVGLAAMLFPPPVYGAIEPGPVLFHLLPMFRAGLTGLLVCLGILALTMTKFITDNDRRREQKPF